ncbi:MAG: DUF4465 domain-containing protein [Bacteroidota bacterium]
MKNNLLFFFLLSSVLVSAQVTVDFEEFNLMEGQFLNQATNDTFSTGNVALFNDYNENYDSWSGWAISATTDTETPGFMNQYSSSSGAGFDGSSTYGVTFAFFPVPIELTGEAVGEPVTGMYVNNGTYAYLSMRDGDTVGKKFGGEDGNDPDFFLLTIKGELNGEVTDSVEFYLADYRFEDNSQDYIITDWSYIDLLPLGNVDRVLLSLSSSDVGQFGMNTPAYVCVDNIITAGTPTSVVDQRVDYGFKIFPNPSTDFIQLDWAADANAQATIFQMDGRMIGQYELQNGTNTISVRNLPQGSYFLRVESEEGWDMRRFIKQ